MVLHFIGKIISDSSSSKYILIEATKLQDFDFRNPTALIGTIVTYEHENEDSTVEIVFLEESFSKAELKIKELVDYDNHQTENLIVSSNIQELKNKICLIETSNESLQKEVEDWKLVVNKLYADLDLLKNQINFLISLSNSKPESSLIVSNFKVYHIIF